MKQKVIEKLATEDAKRWAAAEMFYGPGAGTRRKLLNAEIETKMIDSPEYNELFNIAYENLDMNKFAELAIKERKHLDRIAKTHQNMRALKSGKIQNLTTGVAVVVGLGYAAHVTGYDKVIIANAKLQWAKAQAEYTKRKNASKVRHLQAVYLEENDGQ